MTSLNGPPWLRKLRGRRELITDAISSLSCAAGMFVWSGPDQFIAELPFPLLDGMGQLIASIPLALLAAAAAMVRRRHPLFLMFVSLVGWVTVSAIVVVVFALYALGAFEADKWRVMASTAITLVLVGFPYWRHGGFDETVPISTALCLVPTLLGLWTATRHKLVTNLRDRAARLEREQDLRADQARAEERTRIAHEMHDLVAHRVSLIVLHAAAAEVASEPERIELARAIRAIGRTALDEFRQVLGVLRLDDAPLTPQASLDDLPALVAQSRATGMDVEMQTIGQTCDLPAIVKQASYRVVQEALTNVHKHAGNASTRICMTYRSDSFQVIITNTRPSKERPNLSLPAGGYGLIGLSERIRLIGGELATRPTLDGGFEVAATIPLAEEPRE